MVCIYKITNPFGKVYIGQTVNFTKRMNAYKNLLCKKQTIIYRSLLKYGFENHKVEVLEECVKKALNERERFYQEEHEAIGVNGMNCRYVNTGDKSGSLSEETKQRIREAKTGLKLSKEHKEKIALSGIGRTHSEDTRKKMSDRHSGVKNAMYGKKASKETRKLMSEKRCGVNNGMYGKKHSRETMEKINAAAKNRGKEWRKKIGSANSKGVLIVGTDLVFESVIEAAKHTGVSRSGVAMVCRGECNQMRGYVFKYVVK